MVIESQGPESGMLALSQEAVRSKDTVKHYVLNWQKGEVPSPKQIEQAINVFLAL